MRIFSASLMAASAVLALTSAANAATFAGDFTVTAHSSGDGLLIQTTKIADLSVPFDLEIGGPSKTFNTLFKIGADETTVNVEDDLAAMPINVTFSFAQPSLFNGSVDGTTAGQRILAGFIQNGRLDWDNNGIATFGFGKGGLLQVALTDDVIFSSGILGLSHKEAKVGATFTLLQDSAVPEPASWAMLIAGFGMVGGAMRQRRKATVIFA